MALPVFLPHSTSSFLRHSVPLLLSFYFPSLLSEIPVKKNIRGLIEEEVVKAEKVEMKGRMWAGLSPLKRGRADGTRRWQSEEWAEGLVDGRTDTRRTCWLAD